MQSNGNALRVTLRIFIIIAVLIGGYYFVLWVSRFGEERVTVNVYPENSVIKINDKEYKSGTIYLSNGLYKISATAEGYTKDQLDFKVINKSKDVVLLPKPESKEIIEFLSANQAAQVKREALGGLKNRLESEAIYSQHGLYELLPYTDDKGPFRVDYAFDLSNGPILEISSSNSEGRRNFLKWLKEQDENPTDYTIKYLDYENPFFKPNTNGDETHE